MNESQHLSPQPIYDALDRASDMARAGNCNDQWRQARLEAETLAGARARKARSEAVPAPANPGPAQMEWSDSELLAKSAQHLAVNIAEENRRWGIIPDNHATAASA